MKSWKNVVNIMPNGDTAEEVTVTWIVMSDRLEFFRISNGSGAPQLDRHKRRVRVEASTVQVSNGPGGVSWDLTSSWRGDGKLEVLAHSHTPMRKDAEVTLRLSYFWPAKCASLMKGEQDVFRLRFRYGLGSLSYTVFLPDAREIVYEHLDPAQEDRRELSDGLSDTGRQRKVHLEAHDIQPGEAVGFRLEHKKSSHR